MDKAVLQKTVENLRKNGFDARLAHNKEEAQTLVTEYIVPYGTVGFGGSVTVRELGLPDLARAHKAKVYDHWQEHLSAEEKMDIMRKCLTCDLYITSTNAISESGKIFNIDGNGNRVAAMIFGPKKVVIVAGKNKIAADDEKALARIKTIACPQNAARLKMKTPCVKTGHCLNCQAADRICKITSVMEKKPGLTDITVIIIDEELGY